MKNLIILAAFMIFSQDAFSQLRLGIVGSYGVSIGRSQTTMLGTDEGRRAYEVAKSISPAYSLTS